MLGETNLNQYPLDAPFSYVFQQAVEFAAAGNGSTDFQGVNAAIFNRATVAHELVHTFDVNAPSSINNGGHDSPTNYPAYSSSDDCLMAYLPTSTNPRSRASGRVGLHSTSFPKSEYLTIRRQKDPVPNTICMVGPCP